jgi:hypothetical protein
MWLVRFLLVRRSSKVSKIRSARARPGGKMVDSLEGIQAHVDVVEVCTCTNNAVMTRRHVAFSSA